MIRATPLVLAALLTLSGLAFAPGAQAAPSIAAVSPTSGSTNGGTTLNITGSGFAAGAIVQLVQGSTSATLSNLQVTATSIRGTTPPTPIGAPGTFQIRVTNPDGSSSLSGTSFTYTATASPTISGISPVQGLSTGGTTLTITGTGFSSAVKPMVTVVGVPATVLSATPTTVIVVTAALEATDDTAPSSGNVVVTNPDGSSPATSSQPFTYQGAPSPSVATMTPTTGDANGGIFVTITGSNFVPGATVRFVPTSGLPVFAPTVGFQSATQVRAKTPPLPVSATAYSVEVVNPDGKFATLAQVFSVTAGPTGGAGTFRVTSISPSSGPSSGGTPVTIGGVGFANSPNLQVLFGSNAATDVRFVSNTQVTAITPACSPVANPCSGSVAVRNPDGATSLPLPPGNLFEYKTQVVITNAVSVDTGASNVDTSGTKRIDITGSGFAGPCDVYVGGIKARVEQACSATSVRAFAPAGTPGTKDVQVVNFDGRSATLQGALGYVLSPAPLANDIQSLDPRIYSRSSQVEGGLETTTNGGGILRILGSGFIPVNVTDPVTGFYRYTSPAVLIAGQPAIVIANGTGYVDVIVPAIPFTAVPASTNGAACQSNGRATVQDVFNPTGNQEPPRTSFVACIPADIKVTNLDGQSTTLPGRIGPGTNALSEKVRFSYVRAKGPTAPSCAPLPLPCSRPLTTGGLAETATGGADFATGTTVRGMGTAPGRTFFAAELKAGATAVHLLEVTSDTSASFVTPPMTSAGNVALNVVNPDGQATSIAGFFTYSRAPPPTFSSLVPNRVSARGSSGDPGNDVTISSTAASSNGFTAGMTVIFDQTPVVLHYPEPCNATVKGSDPPVTVRTNCFQGTQGGSGNAIRIRAPGHPEGTVNVRVIALDGQSATVNAALTYTPEDAPRVTDIQPRTAQGVSGNVITITGSGFAQGSVHPVGANLQQLPETDYLKPQVKVDNIVVHPRNVTVLGPTQMQVKLPNHAAGTVGITVTNPDRTEFVFSDAFRYLGTQTNVRLEAASGTQNGGVLVRFIGQGFDPSHRTQAPVILFGSQLATDVSVASATSGVAITPSGPSGPVTVFLVDQDGQTLTIPRGYTYTTAAPPAFTSLTPTAGGTNGGQLVTVLGSNFSPDIKVCLVTLASVTNPSFLPAPNPCVDGPPRLDTVEFVSPTMLKFTTPSSPPGPVDIVLTNPVGTAAHSLRLPASQSLFYYSQAPSPLITAISPTSGDVEGGTPVTISGANFVAGAAVTFDTTAATDVNVASANSITAKTPPHSKGPVSVTVTVPGGLSYTLTPGFTYTGNTTSDNNATTTSTTSGTTTTTGPGTTTTTSQGTTTGPPGATLTSDQIIAANKQVEVAVTRDGDDNIVSFTLPLSLPATAQGVQVFRSTSPFTLLVTLDRTSVDFQSRSYLDPEAPLDAKYLVTVYYANGQGKAASSPDEIPGFDSLGNGVSSKEADNAKLTLIGYILVGVLALFLAILLVVLVLRGRRPPAQDAEMATVPAPGAAPPSSGSAEMRHSVNCPNCGSIFEAYGPKPLRMECPTCGKAGILR